MGGLVLRNITKVFPGDIRAVSNVNLEVQDKEFVVLVGPSGCGKSTILRLIAGLEELTEGEIYIDGRLVNDVAPKDRDIAMVFQNYALYPHMSVFDNLAFGLRQRRLPKADIGERVDEAADILGIGHLLERRPKELSGGERQRVAVGRAIVRKPRAFLFDEPLSNLDAKLRVAMRAELIKLHQRIQTLMIYVTHDQVEAMTMGDRIAVLKQGIVHQMAEPLALYDHPANQFVAGFIGTPPMNFVRGELLHEQSGHYFDAETFRVRIPDAIAPALARHAGREVTLGIRPEDILYTDVAALPVAAATAEVRVEVVEPLGSETWIYLSTGKHSLIARAGARANPRAGSTVRVVLDMNRAHFFDPETELALT
jgi:multiple sugar transport system ATP-binding protein